MMLTQVQKQIVENNMGLVGKVIHDKVRRLGQSGTPSYDDLFQIGCIGLIKAVLSDKGGTFSTYAYRLIWNEICDELIRNTRVVLQEQLVDTVDILSVSFPPLADPAEIHSLRQTILQVKKEAPRGVVRGIECLELMAQGYSSKEIGELIDADPGTVRMWITRARKHLKKLPELQQYAEVG